MHVPDATVDTSSKVHDDDEDVATPTDANDPTTNAESAIDDEKPIDAAAQDLNASVTSDVTVENPKRKRVSVLDDGTVVYDNGTTKKKKKKMEVLADGTVIYDDGTRKKKKKKVQVLDDGTVIYDDGSKKLKPRPDSTPDIAATQVDTSAVDQ